jgi:hypothetical protein
LGTAFASITLMFGLRLSAEKYAAAVCTSASAAAIDNPITNLTGARCKNAPAHFTNKADTPPTTWERAEPRGWRTLLSI